MGFERLVSWRKNVADVMVIVVNREIQKYLMRFILQAFFP
jgi:hypothetical protein